MTTRPQPESHLDANQLNAFTEGALSPPERAICLQHLADCAHCREIAFLAGASLLSEEPVPAPSRRFSRPWWPVLSIGAAGIAAVVITAVLLHRTHKIAPPTAVQTATEARTPPSPAMTAVAPIDRGAPEEPRARAVSKPSHAEKGAAKPEGQVLDDRRVNSAASSDSATASAQAAAGASQQLASSGATLHGTANVAAAPPLAQPSQTEMGRAAKAAPSVTLRAYGASAARASDGFAQISGTITDRSGATIPRAKVTLDQTLGTAHRETFTDATGQFTIGSLQPGKYRLEISSPGFLAQVREVDLGTSQLARVDSQLAPGAASETVEIQSASSALKTESSSLQSLLPDKKAPQTSVSSGARTLALDTSGKLFLSKRMGKHWKAVHGPWKKSTVTKLSLTTDQQFRVAAAQSSWLSTDGEHWHPAN